jgi:hypothetical protein
MCLPDRAATLGQAEAALAQAQQARAQLDTGSGRWQTTEAGRAVRDLAKARQGREKAKRAAEDGARWRDRHAARKEAQAWAQREVDANQRWETHVAPSLTQLHREIALHQACLDWAANRFKHQQAASRAVIDHALEQQRQARNLAKRVVAAPGQVRDSDPARRKRSGTPSRTELGVLSVTQLPVLPTVL